MPQSSHTCERSPVSSPAATNEERWALVLRIAANSSFRRSVRLRELLLYKGRRAPSAGLQSADDKHRSRRGRHPAQAPRRLLRRRSRRANSALNPQRLLFAVVRARALATFAPRSPRQLASKPFRHTRPPLWNYLFDGTYVANQLNFAWEFPNREPPRIRNRHARPGEQQLYVPQGRGYSATKLTRSSPLVPTSAAPVTCS